MKTLDKVFKGKEIILKTKIRLIHALTFSVVNYRARKAVKAGHKVNRTERKSTFGAGEGFYACCGQPAELTDRF